MAQIVPIESGAVTALSARDATRGDAPNTKAMSATEFKQQLAALGFAYIQQTRGFLDLHRDKRTRFRRLIGVRDVRGRLLRRETLAHLIASRLP
jgi:hypothetical protein